MKTLPYYLSETDITNFNKVSGQRHIRLQEEINGLNRLPPQNNLMNHATKNIPLDSKHKEFIDMLKNYERYSNEDDHDELLLKIKLEAIIKFVRANAITDLTRPSGLIISLKNFESPISKECQRIYWIVYDANHVE